MTTATDIPAGLFFEEAHDAPKSFNVILYGRAKAGKTSAACTAPGPILYVNLQGPNALDYARTVARQRGTRVDEVRIAKDEDPRDKLRSVVALLKSDESDYRSVVIDTIGNVRDRIAFAIGGDQPSLPQWGKVGKAIVDIVLTLRDLPVNVVLLAHAEVKDSDEGDRIVQPLVGGRATGDVLAEVDVIGYCQPVQDENGGNRYVAQLIQARGREAGDRSGALGPVRDLDLTEWLETYTAALAADDDDPFTEESK